MLIWHVGVAIVEPKFFLISLILKTIKCHKNIQWSEGTQFCHWQLFEIRAQKESKRCRRFSLYERMDER